MIIGNGKAACHLSYCLNVHPGESWDACRQAIDDYALKVRDNIAPDEPFALGLRLGYKALRELSAGDNLREFVSYVYRHNLYAFSINGFPYGDFHSAPVKENVYAPDWRTAERVDYTNNLAENLATLLPSGVVGSISTVPVSYRAWMRSEADCDAAARGLLESAVRLEEVEYRTGRHIVLALEPEPDCLLDDTDSTIRFFNTTLEKNAAAMDLDFDWRQYIGVCLDTCHAAVVFESPLEMLRALRANNITVAKVQLSAALRTPGGGLAAAQLAPYMEETYLHQVRIKESDGTVRAYPDLTDAARQAIIGARDGEVRVHMHVPLYFQETGCLRSTVTDLDAAFFAEAFAAGVRQFEIETYTFDILPPELSSMPIVESIVREYRAVLPYLMSAYSPRDCK